MDMIYMDNAATSFPKPACVGEAMLRYMNEIGATVNRSSYGPAQEAELTLLSLRERLCTLFGFDRPENAVITPGATWALNMCIKGFLRPGDHCIVSGMEHNAVMRPLRGLERGGVSVTVLSGSADGKLCAEELLREIRGNTRLFVLCHASNVCGSVQDAAALGRVCREAGVHFVLDAAQSAGHLPVDFGRMNLSALCVPGHKGLMGPSGIGAMLFRDDFAAKLSPVVEGGTGSFSDLETQPHAMPDRFEPGTPNIPGIYGFNAALGFLADIGVAAVAAHERELLRQFLRGLEEIHGVRVAGRPETAVVSLDFPGRDNAECADMLAERFGIMTRCGLHCAPSAHRTLGTFPRGTVRFSFGWFTAPEEVDSALEAIGAVAGQRR